MEQNFKSILIHSNNLRRVQLYDNTYNFIDEECNLLSKENFKDVYTFKEGFAIVHLLDNTYNFIDNKCNLLSKQNFEYVYFFNGGFAGVQLSEDNWNYIDTKGNLLSKQNFKYAYSFNEGFAIVKLSDDNNYYIDKDLNFYNYISKTPIPNPFEKELNNINELKINYSTINNIYLIQNPTQEDISSYQKAIINLKQLFPNNNAQLKLDLNNNILELINFDYITIFHFGYQLAIIQNTK
jgi:hypothetical protein